MNNSIENSRWDALEKKEQEQNEKECIADLSTGDLSDETFNKLFALSEEFRQSEEIKNSMELGFCSLLSRREPHDAFKFKEKYNLSNDFVAAAAKKNYDFLMSRSEIAKTDAVFAKIVKDVFNL